MNKEKGNNMTPRLRFKEFAGEWNLNNLGDISILINDKAGTKSYKLMSITAGVGLVSQIEKFGREIAGESYKNYVVIKKGDFAYNKSSTKQYPEGQIAILENEEFAAVPNSIFTCFRVDNKLVSPSFLKFPFEKNIHGDWLRKFIEVGARAHGALSVDIKDLFATPICFPGLPEQQKIAATLTSLDDLITAQTEKIKALQAHKKGLMQQLFPEEGERVPRVRFEEFRDAGEWEESQLGKVASKVGSGITPTGGDRTYKNIGRPFVRSQNVGWGTLILDDIAFIDEVTHAGFSSTEIKQGDVLLNITGASIGRSAIADARVKGGNVNQHVCIIRTQNELLPYFLNLYLLSDFGQKQIESFQAGGNRQGLNFAQIRSLSIPLPPNLAEQQKIAATLSSLDDLITAQTQKLEALKAHKKGLMQGLFVGAEGVESRI